MGELWSPSPELSFPWGINRLLWPPLQEELQPSDPTVPSIPCLHAPRTPSHGRFWQHNLIHLPLLRGSLQNKLPLWGHFVLSDSHTHPGHPGSVIPFHRWDNGDSEAQSDLPRPPASGHQAGTLAHPPAQPSPSVLLSWVFRFLWGLLAA